MLRTEGLLRALPPPSRWSRIVQDLRHRFKTKPVREGLEENDLDHLALNANNGKGLKPNGYNPMIHRGTVGHGVVELEEGAALPDGTQVNVELLVPQAAEGPESFPLDRL